MTNQAVSNPHSNVQIQNLRDFIVQIRHAASDKIKGTGFVVSTDGKIVTCKHVVQDANVEKQAAEEVEVGVYFPQVKDPDMKSHRARVVGCFSEYDDDVVLLQLVGDTVFLSPEKIAVLGTVDESYNNNNPFRSYGYGKLEKSKQISIYVQGEIMGHIEIEQSYDNRLQVNPVELRTRDIRPGVSGAPVLDTKRNLVVGIIAKRYNPGDSSVNDQFGWAVDAQVLSFSPMNLALQDVSVFEGSAPQLPSELEKPEGKPVLQPGINLNNAPPPLKEWVGRAEFLQNLDEDWTDPQRLITGLIGFGGEGKSSLTRRWLEKLLRNRNSFFPQPKGVFWWGFYDKSSVDEFFEALLTFLVEGIDPNSLPSAKVKAQVINAMLKSGRYLFVLDGLEVLQHQDGDDYGLLKSVDLRDWLREFAAVGHESFCLISSRAPLLDLIDFTTYTHRDVERLTVDEGRDLLRKLGVIGTDAELKKVVQEWDGYALVLSLLGSYLVDRFEGKIEHLKDIRAPTEAEPKYDRVRRVLRRYDEHLTEEERKFLEVFSAFRLPVPESALEPVFGHDSPQQSPESSPPSPPNLGGTRFQSPPSLGDLGGKNLIDETQEGYVYTVTTSFEPIVKRLVNYRILRYNSQARHYTTHPLIRAHYLERLQNNLTVAQPVHRRIADYYLNSAGETPEKPTLDDLKPLIEAVHHLCQAGDYDEADNINWERINQRDRGVIIHKLGAYETNLSVMQSFFSKGDTSQEPQVSDPLTKGVILNNVGLCLMSLGRMDEAPPFYERGNAIALSRKDWHKASAGYQNLTELYAYLGKLTASAKAAREALTFARNAGSKEDECYSIKWQAWAAHLQGDLETASTAFQRAEALEREIEPDTLYLYSLRGIQHADHLRRVGDVDYARKVTKANLEICKEEHWLNQISWCHRVLGDLDADADNYDSAQSHYQEALKIARSITKRDVLIEALLARGRWLAKRGQVAAARRDLDEALNYALAGGYRIYEADIRVSLAWAHLAAGNPSAAQREAEKAQRMSAEMGYHWGQVDAKEVLAKLE